MRDVSSARMKNQSTAAKTKFDSSTRKGGHSILRDFGFNFYFRDLVLAPDYLEGCQVL
ncbi:uncharacterized protein G2W53_026550 [Senna tora]|uniref:Uncharacterized protein n=1 Tax=Senna tora TaxID=362788 RepID=A0A834THN0_9FABA|nr:uncharacterized protein G2W53_026550 [Senna tora]